MYSSSYVLVVLVQIEKVSGLAFLPKDETDLSAYTTASVVTNATKAATSTTVIDCIEDEVSYYLFFTFLTSAGVKISIILVKLLLFRYIYSCFSPNWR